MKLYQAIARAVNARNNCTGGKNPEWEGRHQASAEHLVREHMPSGSGWDLGTTLDWDRSTGERLIFMGSFHHMDDHGRYDGWTDHEVWVRPSLSDGVSIVIKGRNRDDIKDYLWSLFYDALVTGVEYVG